MSNGRRQRPLVVVVVVIVALAVVIVILPPAVLEGGCVAHRIGGGWGQRQIARQNDQCSVMWYLYPPR